MMEPQYQQHHPSSVPRRRIRSLEPKRRRFRFGFGGNGSSNDGDDHNASDATTSQSLRGEHRSVQFADTSTTFFFDKNRLEQSCNARIMTSPTNSPPPSPGVNRGSRSFSKSPRSRHKQLHHHQQQQSVSRYMGHANRRRQVRKMLSAEREVAMKHLMEQEKHQQTPQQEDGDHVSMSSAPERQQQQQHQQQSSGDPSQKQSSARHNHQNQRRRRYRRASVN